MLPWERTRSFFPLARDLDYLDHAGGGPISTRVEEALREWSGRQLRRGSFDNEADEEAAVRTRSRLAALLCAATHEIALVRNTSEALGLVAQGLSWRSSDVVVTTDRAHPSTLYPWLALSREGVEVQRLRTRRGRIDLEELERRLASPRVRLLCIASVDYLSGVRHDLQAIGALCSERGVLFCVDAIQSLGCLDLDPTVCSIDFLASGGQKWLLAGPGTGLLYCASRAQPLLEPRVIGWHSVQEPDALEREQHTLRSGGARFEPGTPDSAAACRLGAATDLILELGIEAIQTRVLALRQRLEQGLASRDAQIVSEGDASGIVAFTLRHETPTETWKRLREQRIHVASRGAAVRVSPHFYNREDEIDRLVHAL